MPLTKLDKDQPVPLKNAFRHLIFFQIKLFADAVRDVLLSPVSVFAFISDAIFRPPVKESLSYRLMLIGRKSDRMINLFGEHTESGEFTIDETVNEIESALLNELNRRKTQDKSS